MYSLQALDVGLFRFINLTLMNPFFDRVMPFLSGNAFFVPALIVAGILLVCKGRQRGLLCLLLLILAVSLTDGLICRTIKYAVARPRPFLALPDVHCLLGKTNSGSLPSSHAANWFAATMVMFIYYRRSLWFMLPAAVLVSFSRVYNGVHYPSDVLAGALLGAGCAAATVCLVNTFWQWAGRRWFPLWWQKTPSLVEPSAPEVEAALHTPPPRDTAQRAGEAARRADVQSPKSRAQSPHTELDQHWLRLGYVCIALSLLLRLAYLASGTIELGEDEAYQWLWSKHLALSYFSKPPLIAYIQFLGTSLWGDTAFGVRFFSPIIAAILGFIVLRFFAREVNARAGFLLLLVITAAPMMSVGAVLMTIDPLSVLFWTAAMLACWRAIQEDGATRHWLWTGLWMGLGFLSKYTELFQLLCWAVFFVLWPPARKHLRRPGPYLALLVNLLCAVPVLIWNYQHQWATIGHVADRAGAGTRWELTRAPKYLAEFLAGEMGLLNPIFFIGMIWAAVAFWRRGRHDPRLVYLFSMGAPLFLVYLLYTVRARVLPNWIAPSVLPLFCLMAIYWDTRWRLGAAQIKAWLAAGLIVGFTIVIFLHNTDLAARLTGRFLPVNLDPLHRVRGETTMARVVGEAREQLLAEGKPVFIIADHYGLAGELSFYLPEAKIAVSENPLVYCQTSSKPENQFYFWPGYSMRKGENAIFILELDRGNAKPRAAPPRLEAEFESVTDTGIREVLYHGQVLRPLQIWACRGLR